MRVAFCADGGREAGLGHLRRCVSLGQAFLKLGVASFFRVRTGEGLAELPRSAGLEAIETTKPLDPAEVLSWVRDLRAEVLVVDSYDPLRVTLLKGATTECVTVAIVDEPDCELPASILVNGAPGAENLSYLMSAATRRLLGAQYALLRPEFAEPPARNIVDSVRRVLVTVGGADPYGLTPKLVGWALETPEVERVDVICGPFFAESPSLPDAWTSSRVTLHKNPEIRELMLVADFAICAGGQTALEMAATGTPALAIRTAENQTQNLRGLAASDTLIWVGEAGSPGLNNAVCEAITMLAHNSVRRRELSLNGRRTVDGRGAYRVAAETLDCVENRSRCRSDPESIDT